MSDYDSSQLYDNSYVELMEYLIEKLESRYNSILKYNKLLESSDSPNSLFDLKKDLISLFNGLQEDFRQGIFAIKALTTQNKKITEELKVKNIENKNMEIKLNNIILENKNLKFQIIKFKGKNSSQIDIQNSSNNNLEDNYENKQNDDDNSNKNINLNNERKDNEGIKKNNYEFEQLSNVKNIMDNMKKNKLKFKMAIEQHFINSKCIDNDN